MKEILSFIKGAALVVALVAAMIFGVMSVWNTEKLNAEAGYIVIEKKLYVLTPAEAKVVEQPKTCGQACTVE